jgi:hypothetical protein
MECRTLERGTITNTLLLPRLNKRVISSIDMKNIIFLMTLIMGLSIIITTNAQGQTQNNTQVNQTGITNYLDSFEGVTVLYESPKTLVLTIADVSIFGPAAVFGPALDYAKEKGYSIDAVTVFTETSSAVGSTTYLTPNYTVFMSK